MRLYKKFTDMVFEKASTPDDFSLTNTSLRVLYGLMTGTELSGSGVSRKVSKKWNSLLRTHVLHNMDYGIEAVGNPNLSSDFVEVAREINSPVPMEELIEAHVKSELTENFLANAKALEQSGLSRHEAQKMMIEEENEYAMRMVSYCDHSLKINRDWFKP